MDRTTHIGLLFKLFSKCYMFFIIFLPIIKMVHSPTNWILHSATCWIYSDCYSWWKWRWTWWNVISSFERLHSFSASPQRQKFWLCKMRYSVKTVALILSAMTANGDDFQHNYYRIRLLNSRIEIPLYHLGVRRRAVLKTTNCYMRPTAINSYRQLLSVHRYPSRLPSSNRYR